MEDVNFLNFSMSGSNPVLGVLTMKPIVEFYYVGGVELQIIEKGRAIVSNLSILSSGLPLFQLERVKYGIYPLYSARESGFDKDQGLGIFRLVLKFERIQHRKVLNEVSSYVNQYTREDQIDVREDNIYGDLPDLEEMIAQSVIQTSLTEMSMAGPIGAGGTVDVTLGTDAQVQSTTPGIDASQMERLFR
uniref:Uncharacterized protein n=1 Tax=Solanum tuberosum TaxID=4113 RepID=M1DYC4_SOLTU